MSIGKQLTQVRTGLGLVLLFFGGLFLTPPTVIASFERGISQDDGPVLLAEVLVTEDGGFELYAIHGSTDERVLMAELTLEDIDAAKALAESLGQGVQIVPLADDEVSAQLALRLPQVFAVTENQCALMGYYSDGKTGTEFFDC